MWTNHYFVQVSILNRLASSLTDSEIEKLHQEIVATLSEAVEKGGSTIRSYINSQGQIGMFQLELYVYGRKGEACKKCGTPLGEVSCWRTWYSYLSILSGTRIVLLGTGLELYLLDRFQSY